MQYRRKGNFFFKKYNRSQFEELRYAIKYAGKKSSKWNLIEGIWRQENNPLDETKRFYLASNKEEFRELETILGELHFKDLYRRLSELQKEFPFIPVVPAQD